MLNLSLNDHQHYHDLLGWRLCQTNGKSELLTHPHLSGHLDMRQQCHRPTPECHEKFNIFGSCTGAWTYILGVSGFLWVALGCPWFPVRQHWDPFGLLWVDAAAFWVPLGPP